MSCIESISTRSAGSLAGEFACRLQAAAARHRDVQDGKVDVVVQCSLDRFNAV
jgi:hypothetical protein